MLKKIPIHPILFAVYPILFLYTHNISLLEINHIFTPVIWSTVGVVIIWSVLNLIIRNRFKSSAFTSSIIVLFFSYGHMIVALNNFPENVIGISSDLYVSINYLLILGIVGYMLIKYTINYLVVTGYINLIGLMLLLFPLYTIFTNYMPYGKEGIDQAKNSSFNIDKIENPEVFEKPDIYYIILDGYGREDVLKSVYGYDNKGFLNELKMRGFFIATKSNANYCQTLLSLSSTLNMNYLDTSYGLANTENYRRYLSSTVLKNRVTESLKQIGYKFVTFATGYSGTEIKNSDLYISPRFSLDEFQFMIIGTTPLYKLLELIPDQSPIYLHRQRILYTLDKIPDVNLDNKPMFLFAHIVAPHPPFVLNLNGESFVQLKNHIFNYHDGSHYHSFIESIMREYKENYISQLKELNKLIIEMLDEIMAKEGRDKVVIIQSDHGPGFNLNWEKPSIDTFNERLPILNAYFFPNEDDILISESITPVNTFRILFNHYFNSNYEILENKSYFSTWSNPQRFICVDRYFQ